MKDLKIHHNGEIKKCICKKKDVMRSKDGLYPTITHNAGDICECMEILNKDNENIGYYIKYDIFRYRVLDFNEYYDICDD